MSPERRQRFAFFALALLLHASVFYLVYRFVVFEAPPDVADDAAFARITIPTHSVTPPQAPSARALQMPSLLPPAVTTPAPIALIVTPMPNTFNLPKIDTTAAMNTVMARLPAPTNNPGGTGSGSNSSSGSLGAGGFATASSSEMEAFLEGDKRPGEIVGVFFGCMNTSNEAAQMDAIRQKDITSIGWYFHENGSKITPGIKHGTDVPTLTSHPEWFAGYIDELMYPQIIRLRLHNMTNQVKTLVLVWDFHGDYDPGYGRDSEGALYADIVAQLRAQNVRLCVISFENSPCPPLLQYVKESGGAVLFPKGIPADDTASQLLQDTER